MKVKIVKNLMDAIEGFFGDVEGHRTDPDFIKLCDQIQGKEVNLVNTGDDWFYTDDPYGYWLPRCCWEPI